MRYSLCTLLLLLVIGPTFVVILYVLSAGPALWLVDHNLVSGEVWFAAYTPLSQVAQWDQHDGNGWFSRAMNWYLQTWGHTIGV